MATMILARNDAAMAELAHERIVPLRDWLNGQWGAVFSHPDDFAPSAGTPSGFTNRVADGLLAAGVRPITFCDSLEHVTPNWLDHAVNDDAVVVLDARCERVIDLAERALATQLAALHDRFVLILDERGRCRTSLQYRAESLHTRPRSVEELVEIVGVLRGDRAVPVRRVG